MANGCVFTVNGSAYGYRDYKQSLLEKLVITSGSQQLDGKSDCEGFPKVYVLKPWSPGWLYWGSAVSKNWQHIAGV